MNLSALEAMGVEDVRAYQLRHCSPKLTTDDAGDDGGDDGGGGDGEPRDCSAPIAGRHRRAQSSAPLYTPCCAPRIWHFVVTGIPAAIIESPASNLLHLSSHRKVSNHMPCLNSAFAVLLDHAHAHADDRSGSMRTQQQYNHAERLEAWRRTG
jgi:hypothetical protein